MFCFFQVFSFMLRLKRLSWVLRDIWFHLKHVGKCKFSFLSGRQLAPAFVSQRDAWANETLVKQFFKIKPQVVSRSFR